jgi:small conductance mechanosensitive channel
MTDLLADIGKQLIKLQVRVTTHAADMVLALAVLFLGYVFFRLTAAFFRKMLLRSKVQDAFARLLIDNVYKAVVLIATLIIAAAQLGINVVAPLAGIGLLGVALGFAAQDSLSNIIAGFLIFFDKPFKVRDYVTLGEHYGRVELITMRSTRIRTQDNKYVVIPNQKIINEVLVDHSTNGDTRLVIPVTIEYEASIQKAREAILTEIYKIDGILKKPEADVVVEALNESGVLLQVRFWIASAADERRYHFAAGEATKNALDAAGVHFAYPRLKMVNH